MHLYISVFLYRSACKYRFSDVMTFIESDQLSKAINERFEKQS